MQDNSKTSALILGVFLFMGLFSLALITSNSAIKFKEYERTVTVKGLSEREYDADIVIWPIQFTVANNDLGSLYESIETTKNKIGKFLQEKGIGADELSFSTAAITDKSAQQYGNSTKPEFRYTATQTVTVYSSKIKEVNSGIKKGRSRSNQNGLSSCSSGCL